MFCRTCVTAIFNFLWTVISGLFRLVCRGVAWLYSYEEILILHAIVTFIGFIGTFVVSKYWDAHIGDNIDSENPLGCHCPVAPAPSLPIGVEWTFFLNLWITYHSAIVITLYCLAIAATAFVEILLVAQWNTDRLARIREALAPCETLGQLRKSIIEMSILRVIVFLGDMFCDPKEVDVPIFLTFVFAYLHFAGTFKMIGLGNDFGWLDGLVSVMLAAFEHLVRPWSFMQLVGILLTSIIICIKNTMWSGHGTRIQIQRTEEEEGTSLVGI